MKRKIENMYICALLMVLLSCGSGGGSKPGGSTSPTPSIPTTPVPLTPAEPVIGVNDVYYNNEIVIREKYFKYLPTNSNRINNSISSSGVEKISSIAGTPVTKRDYEVSAGIPMNRKIFLHNFGTIQQATDFSSDLTALNSYRAAIGAELMDEYIARINSHGGDNLYIWPAGDTKGNKNPSLQGGLPYFESSLTKSWINVVALANKSGTTGLEWKDLEPLSNAGIAKSWTITAVSENGTSAKAAENVATVAGQLYEKFPGMKMGMIRDIIFSTATDIGALGTDDIFGVGLLNGAKALGGPTYIYGEVVVPTSKTWTFNNYIRDGKLKKEGYGKLVLAEDVNFTRNTEIKEGILDIRKRHSSGINIESNGILITNPNTKIGKDVTNKGTLKNIGKGAVIEGNYKAEIGSVTEAEIGSKLIIKGTIKIDGREKNQTLGSTLKVLNNNYVTATPTTVTVLEAEKGIEGQFSKMETDELINGKVENDGNSIKATVNRKNVEEYVNNLNNSDEMQKDTAKNVEVSFKELDKKIEEGNTDVSKFALSAAKLQKNSLSFTSSTLDSLSGQIYASAQALTFQQSQTVNKDLSNRLVMLGTLDNVRDKFGLWISGIGASGKLKQAGYAEGKTKVYGGQVGIDRKFGKNLILGTALSYSEANVKFNRHGGESDSDNFGVSLYGRIGNYNNPLYVQGRVGIGFVNSEVKRDIILSSNDISQEKIEHNDKVISGYLETGFDVKKENFILTPFVGILHDTVRRGSFNEKNSQFGLKADKKTYNQTSGFVGIRSGQSFNFKNGSKTTVQGYVTYQRALNNEDLSFEASYSGLSNAKFKVKGIGLSKNKAWVGVGILNEVNPNFAWYVNYDGKIDKKAQNNVFTTGIRVNF
jgi:serine protease